jgi:hypothetical protein
MTTPREKQEREEREGPPPERVKVVGPPVGVDRPPGPQPFPHQAAWVEAPAERVRQRGFPKPPETKAPEPKGPEPKTAEPR